MECLRVRSVWNLEKGFIRFFTAARFLYRDYFRVRTMGIENVPARGRAMLVGNHSGGIALDALIVLTALFLEKEPPRLAQAMADKFLGRTPVVSRLLNRLGQFTGLPEHVTRMLDDERLILVFPEGARGTAKLFGVETRSYSLERASCVKRCRRAARSFLLVS